MDRLDPKVKQGLAALGIDYEVLVCDPDLADTAAFCEHYGYSPAQAANTIIVASKTNPTQYVACVVLATTKLDVNKKIRELTGVKRWSFASGEQTLALTSMLIGGVTVFGLPPDLTIYVDAAVMQQPEIIMGSGNRSGKLLLKPQELKKLSNLEIIEQLGIKKEA